MGKGQIISNSGGAQYQLQVTYGGRARVEGWIADLTTQIAALQAEIDEMDDGAEKEIKQLKKISLEKRRTYLQENMPDDPTASAYCVDLTTDLSGEVGTIEVPNEDQLILIRPGYGDDAAYDSDRDGILTPAIAQSAAQLIFNHGVFPGWQKYYPTYRTGTIVNDSLDFDNDTCDICLDPAISSAQSLNVNQNSDDDTDCETTAPNGWNDFCGNNPYFGLCSNTVEGSPIHVGNSLYETIDAINQSVNSSHPYKTDQSGWGVGEYWNILDPGDSGDCEDFCLTKADQLIDAGMDPANLQIAAAYTETGEYHAVLLIETTNRGTLVLDNRSDLIFKKSKLQYSWHKKLVTGNKWVAYGGRLNSVPIEYMSCNSQAFADGDRVVVEFTGQDWDSPRVIGFMQAPQACTSRLYGFSRLYPVFYPAQRSWTRIDYPPQDTERQDGRPSNMAHFQQGRYSYLAGGSDQRIDSQGNPRYCRRFDKQAWSWTVMANYPSPRRYNSGGLGAFSGYGFMVGGIDRNPGDFLEFWFIDDNEKYDINSDSWSSVNDCPFIVSVDAGGFVTIGEYGFVLEHTHYNWVSGPEETLYWPLNCEVARYDPAANSWRGESDFPIGRINEYFAPVGHEGNIYHFGLYQAIIEYDPFSLGADYLPDCYTFDTATRSWSAFNQISTEWSSDSLSYQYGHGGAASFDETTIWLNGGRGMIRYNQVTGSYSYDYGENSPVADAYGNTTMADWPSSWYPDGNTYLYGPGWVPGEWGTY